MKHNSGNNDAREIKFGLFYGGEAGEHTGVSFVELSNIFVMHDAILIGTE